MKDLLGSHLTPADDGRAFTDAVLLQASGALHRRRAAADAAQTPAFDWLARWARPWVVAALVAVAVLAIIPSHPWSRPAETAAVSSTDAMVASLLPADMAIAASTETTQER
jgi:hypothetical protein